MHSLTNKMEQLKAIKRGHGTQYLLDETYKILGNPLLIFDMEYKLLAASNASDNEDPIWNEFLTYGNISVETIEFCKNEHFIDAVANSAIQSGVTYLISDKLKYDRIFGQIYNKKNIPIADLVVVECEKTFDDNMPELIKKVCVMLSEELSEREIAQDYGQAYQESVIKKLIEGSIQDRAFYAGHIANIDRDFKDNIFVAVADISSCDSSCDKLVYFRDLFIKTLPSLKYAIYSTYIVILITSNKNKIDTNKNLKALYKIGKKYNFPIGISSSFENLYELKQYYFEAINNLNEYSKKKDS